MGEFKTKRTERNESFETLPLSSHFSTLYLLTSFTSTPLSSRTMTLSPYTSPNRRHLSPRLHKITSKTPSPRKTQLKRSIDGAFVGIGHHIPLEFDVEVRKGVFMRLEYCVGFGARAGAEFNLRRRYSAEYHNLKLRRLFERAIERDVAPEYRRMLIENEQSRTFSFRSPFLQPSDERH